MRDLWKLGTITSANGDIMDVKIGEVAEYKYLGVWFRVRGNMFKRHLKKKPLIKQNGQGWSLGI